MTIATYIRLNNIKRINDIKIIDNTNMELVSKEFKNISYKFEFSNQYANDPNYMTMQISTELYSKLIMLNMMQ